MQQTFQIKTGNLNAKFIDSIKAIFGNKELRIIIEDIEKESPVTQSELYAKSLTVRDRFKHIQVDPNLDLSSLANEVNL